MKRSLLLALACLGCAHLLRAQTPDAERAAIGQLALERLGAEATLTPDDKSAVEVAYAYTDERVGISYAYLQQYVGGLPIEGATASVGIREGQVRSFASRLVDHVDDRVASVVPKLDDEAAIRAAARAIGEAFAGATRALPARGTETVRRYEAPEFASDDLQLADYYLLGDDGKLRRALGVTIDHARSPSLYRVSVDAATGEILRREDFTVSCSFDRDFLGRHAVGGACDHVAEGVSAVREVFATTSAPLGDGSSYRVFPWPAESPNHGAFALVQEPADSAASPFGWHDTDGQPGPEYTITRGNNTHAYLDALDEDSPSEDEPDGGASLTFDFPYSGVDEPIAQTDATVTNLFYAVNQMHDFTYAYGFDEPAGNFQQNNYGNGGQGNDAVQSQSQDGAQLGANDTPDASHINNANFGTPSDGGSGRMQMYLWDRGNGGNSISAAAPTSVVGETFGEPGTADASWGDGALVTSTTDITAGVIDARDNVQNVSFTDACEPLVNAADLVGRIAMIDRGTCQFGSKALRAQEAGAVGVIICNFEDPAAGMAPGADGGDVTIPTLMLPLSGCTRIRELAGQFPNFRLRIAPPDDPTTTYVSGSYDNGIIAHEFGHGISNRLTGGPGAAGCLGNAEQMGEGWSDFFSLVTSVRPGDFAEMRRGIGTYAIREPVDGGGIRNYPYSRDMTVNPVTFDDVANGDFSQPHGIGSIWATMLWDLYWNMVDAHGFDPDQFHGTGGNNRAIQLVMTGMKLQPCNPGFADGRDAILEADELLYGGENQRLIWATFARRGLGFGADQGDPDDRFDQTSSFTLPLDIANEAYFTKSATPEIEPGGQVTVDLDLAYWIEDSTPEATITDVLPAGATLLDATVSASDYSLDGDVITFPLGALDKGDSIAISYAYTAPDDAPVMTYYEPIASDDPDRDFERENFEEDELANLTTYWELIEDDGFGDDFSFRFEGVTEQTQPYLEMSEGTEFFVAGDKPYLSFFHRYEMSATQTGGIVEVFDERDQTWKIPALEDYKRNGPRLELPYQTLVIPNAAGFLGTDLEWHRVLLDLSDYAGANVRLRWRYGRGGNASGEPGFGWQVDELAFMDAVTYNTTAEADLGEGAPLTARAPDIGTFVRNGTVVDVRDLPAGGSVRLSVFPNPTAGQTALNWDADLPAGTVEVYDATGRIVSRRAVALGERRFTVDLSAESAGLYTVRSLRGAVEQTIRVVRR